MEKEPSRLLRNALRQKMTPEQRLIAVEKQVEQLEHDIEECQARHAKNETRLDALFERLKYVEGKHYGGS